MIISCPSCGASFNVKPEALGPNGRSVKCSKCAHRWHATADEEAPEAQAAAAVPATEETAAPEREAEAPTPEPEAEAPTPEPEAETLPAGDAAVEASAEEAEAATASAEDAETAAAPEPPPGMEEALGFAAEAGEDDSEEAPGRRRRRLVKPVARKPRRSMARVLSIFVLLLVVCGAGSAAVLMKNDVMMWLPASQKLYAMIGMGPEVLGQGLQIAEPTPRKEIDGNDEILVVEGEIRNVADKAVDVPLMRGALLDEKGKELHIWTFTAAKSRIEAGENARYRTEFRNPPVEAQSLDITFTQPTAAAPENVKLEQKDADGMMTNSTAQQH